MRGKLNICCLNFALLGITPADAGKTYIKSQPDVRIRDHPRGCGENILTWRLRNEHLGSPPRMRGKRLVFGRLGMAVRITPADAGKTPPTAAVQPAIRDHPRGCGENGEFAMDLRAREGSPPRMRGKQATACCWHFTAWITPADAGKTS